nr:reverse transcriptase domain-containing protein [Tanacetum cinerariifolium]
MTNLRNEITRFQQRFDESFYEAWVRFYDLLRACRHHGFFELHQLDTFYNALNVNDQDSLNSAAGGNFLDKMPQECLKIIESKSKVRQSRTRAVLSKVGTSSSTPVVSSEVAELKDLVRTLLLDKKNQSSAPVLSHASVKAGNNFSQNRGGNFNQSNFNHGGNFNQGQLHRPQVNQPSAYQAPAYQAPNPQTQSVSQTVFESYVKANDAVLRNMQNQGQNVQNQLANLTDMLSKFIRSNTASSSGGVAYQVPANSTSSKVVKKGTEVTKDQVQTPSSPSTAPVQPPVSQSETSTLIFEPVVAPVSTPMPNMKSFIPYPSRRDNERRRMDECLALADLGASINLMPFSVWEALSLPELTPTCMTLELADRSVSKPIGIAKDVSFKVVVFHFPADFMVVDFEPDPREADAFLGLEDDPDLPKINPFYYDPEGDILLLETILNSKPLPPLLNHEQYLPSYKKELKVCEAKTIKSSVDEPPEVALKDLPPYLEYAFLEGNNKLPGINPKFCTHKILMKEDYKPVVQHQRRVNPKIHDVIKKEVEKLLNAGLIYPISDCPWVSPENELIPTRLVIGWWVCIDYRKLNEATRKDHFPLPFMDQMLERLAGNEFYCFLDGFFRYFQIPIVPRNLEKTTFTCPYGTFAYRRMSFGLCNAPGTFQRCMLAIFHDMVEKTMEVFMDDFSVFRNSFENSLSRLDKMLQRCEDTNLSLNWEKSHFMVKEGIVLGHKISKNGIEVNRAKVDVIAKLPHPTTVKGVRSFLGHAGFYRRFIQDFSKISRPMTHLLEKNTPFIFFEDCIKAFQTLKKKLTEAPILIAPNWDLPFELICDARDFAIGAVLGKRHEKHFKPIHYASKMMNNAETNYTTTEKEMLAVVYAFKIFWSYLIMNKSIVHTDHSALKYLFDKKDAKARLLRWVLVLQ